MREHELYEIYECYLCREPMTEGRRKLLLMSADYFDDFVRRYEENPFFRSSLQSEFASLVRDRRIKSIGLEPGRQDSEKGGQGI